MAFHRQTQGHAAGFPTPFADHRLVLRDRGRFVCEPDTLGRHGDTFDAAKLALHALTDSSGALASLAGIYYGPNDPLRHLPPRGPWR